MFPPNPSMFQSYNNWWWNGNQWICGCPPGCPPPAPCCPPPAGPWTGPLAGVQDGSFAGPGIVGEFLQGNANGTLVAPTHTGIQQIVGTASPLQVSPGDWDIDAYIYIDQNVYGVSVICTPVPTGMSDQMTGSGLSNITDAAPVPMYYLTVSMQRVRLSCAVATLIPFQVTAWIGSETTDGTTAWQCNYVLKCSARRMR